MNIDAQLFEAARELEEAQAQLEALVVKAAETERDYKMARSLRYVQTEGTVAEREAAVDAAISDLRYEAHLAEGLRSAAQESVRNRRQILSAVQSLANLAKAEAEFARIDPRVSA